MTNPYAAFAIALLAIGVAAAPAEAKRMDPVLLQGEARAIDGDTLQAGRAGSVHLNSSGAFPKEPLI